MASLPNSPSGGSFSFANCVAAFFNSADLPFAEVLSADRIASVFAKHDNLFGRSYSTAIVLWAFMSQVLRDGKEASCQSAVSRISSYLRLHEGYDVDADTRDYCRARRKLSERALRELSQDVAVKTSEQIDPQHLFHGRHAKLIDGSTFTMPDTVKNQKAYPQNPNQRPGIGFPIARFVVVISLATACVVDAAMGKYMGKETGETALLRQLLQCFVSGDIAVADRFYGNYWSIALLMQQGVDICFRKHARWRTDFRRGKRLGKNDHIIVLQRPPRPSWMSEELYQRIPEEIRVRETRYTIATPGRKHEPFVILTSLFEEQSKKQQVSYQDIAQLFGFRWNVELDIRSIKTHMNLNHLRCKSPEMIHREFWTTILAYNAIRTTAARSGALAGVPSREISFVSCCQYVLAAWDIMARIDPEQVRAYCETRLKSIAQCKVANRKGRIEPRVRKKRPGQYKLMMKPRKQLQHQLRKGDNSFEQK